MDTKETLPYAKQSTCEAKLGKQQNNAHRHVVGSELQLEAAEAASGKAKGVRRGGAAHDGGERRVRRGRHGADDEGELRGDAEAEAVEPGGDKTKLRGVDARGSGLRLRRLRRRRRDELAEEVVVRRAQLRVVHERAAQKQKNR